MFNRCSAIGCSRARLDASRIAPSSRMRSASSASRLRCSSRISRCCCTPHDPPCYDACGHQDETNQQQRRSAIAAGPRSATLRFAMRGAGRCGRAGSETISSADATRRAARERRRRARRRGRCTSDAWAGRCSRRSSRETRSSRCDPRRVIRDDDERAARREPVAQRRKRADEPWQLVVHGDAHRLKEPRELGRIRCASPSTARMAPTRSSLVSNGRFARRRTISRARRAARGSSPYSLKIDVSVASSSSLRMSGGVGRGVAAHAHVEPRARPERESAVLVVDLVRRDAEVEQNAVERHAVERGQLVERRVVRLDGDEPARDARSRAAARSPAASASGSRSTPDDDRRRRLRSSASAVPATAQACRRAPGRSREAAR